MELRPWVVVGLELGLAEHGVPSTDRVADHLDAGTTRPSAVHLTDDDSRPCPGPGQRADAPCGVNQREDERLEQPDDDERLLHRTRMSVGATEGGRTGNVVVVDEPAARSFDPAFVQATASAGVVWTDDPVAAIQDILRRRAVGVMRAVDEAGGEAVIARTRALRRAGRDRPDSDAADTASELFGVWWVAFDSIGLHRPSEGELSRVRRRCPGAGRETVGAAAKFAATDRRCNVRSRFGGTPPTRVTRQVG